MWGTSLPEDKLAGGLGNVIGATSIGGRRSDFFYSKKIGAGQFGTFATISAISGLMHRSKQHLYSITSSAAADMPSGTSRPSAFAVFKLITNSNLVV